MALKSPQKSLLHSTASTGAQWEDVLVSSCWSCSSSAEACWAKWIRKPRKGAGNLDVCTMKKNIHEEYPVSDFLLYQCTRGVLHSCASRHAWWIFMSSQKCEVGWDFGRSHSQAAALMPRPSLTCVCLHCYWKPLLKGLTNSTLFIKCFTTFAVRKLCLTSKPQHLCWKCKWFLSSRDAELIIALFITRFFVLGDSYHVSHVKKKKEASF